LSQHDYVIDNQTSANLRVDLNNALAAIVSQNSGSTAPASTFANQLWYDTSTDQLKQRNETNTVWITLGTTDQTNNKFEPNQTFATQAEAQAGTDNTKAMTSLRVNEATTTLFNVTGAAPVYACRAWVNFNGTGTPSIRASGNVSSITDSGTGNYTVNFTVAMPDANIAAIANYSVNDSASGSNNDGQAACRAVTTTSVGVFVADGSGAARDAIRVSVVVFR